ncbi:hypothetical protein AVEN_56272-1 [Araneus ventricosus]|uniref:Uncharacterized protein n=1 Tax=Araneus ventricosus TaxID=182803 RepID=A0A4Y2FYC2_ARAVE|nr:hypothetical protein AVEN_56272-1 [Araneus ventricosus]
MGRGKQYGGRHRNECLESYKRPDVFNITYYCKPGKSLPSNVSLMVGKRVLQGSVLLVRPVPIFSPSGFEFRFMLSDPKTKKMVTGAPSPPKGGLIPDPAAFCEDLTLQ